MTLSIPPQLVGTGYKFIKLNAKSKNPVEKWSNVVHQYNVSSWQIQNHLISGGNYGVISGYGGLCCFDADEPDRLEELGVLAPFKGTFTVRTGGKRSGAHYYFSCHDLIGKQILLDPERKDEKGNPIHLGELYGAGNYFLVGPGCIHPDTGKAYSIINDVEILAIERDIVDKAIAPCINKKETRTEPRERRIVSSYGSSISDKLGLRVEEFLIPVNPIKHGDELQGEHPIHGSDNGTNLSVNPATNEWYCHRCESGGGPLEALAVSEGIIRCDESGAGCLTGDKWNACLEALKRRGYDVSLPKEPKKIIQPIQTAEPLEELPPLPTAHIHKLKCTLEQGHFVHDYMEYWAGRTDAYPEFYHMGAVTLLSIAIDRKIHIPLSFADIYTNVWSMALGQSSVSRKTTALGKAAVFASISYYETALPGSFSTEALFEKLSEHPRAWMIKDECAGILQGINKKAYLADLRDFLSDIFECTTARRSLRTSKRKDKTEFLIQDPYVTFAWATTPESYEQSVTPLDVQSGFLARFIYYAPRYPKDTMGVSVSTTEMRDNLNVLGSRYAKVSKALSKFYEIEMVPGESSLKEYNAWYLVKQTELMNKYSIEGTVFSRLSTYIFKLAAVYYVGSAQFLQDVDDHIKSVRPFNAPKKPEGQTDLIKNRFEIPYPYFMEALDNVRDYFLPAAVDIVSDLDSKASNNIQKMILQHIKDLGGRVTRSWLLRKMRIRAKELDEHIDTLEDGDSIRIDIRKKEGDKKDTTYITLVEVGS
jgi:hypothetical protein